MALKMNVKGKSAGKSTRSASTKAKSTSAAKSKNTSTKAKTSTAKKGKSASTTAPVIDVDGAVATKILKALAKSKKGKTSNELNTTPAIMQELEKAGKVKRNGTKPTGQRGRPPILWVIK
jgi:hypothetical protein